MEACTWLREAAKGLDGCWQFLCRAGGARVLLAQLLVGLWALVVLRV